jgi:hypothetical protein
MNENIFSFPWLKEKPVVLGMCKKLLLQDFTPWLWPSFSWWFNLSLFNCLAGSRFRDAFQDPGAYLAIEPLFEVCHFW